MRAKIQFAVVGCLALGSLACDGTEAVEVELTISRPPCPNNTACGQAILGQGLMVVSDDPSYDELAQYEGQRTLYAEAKMPSGVTAVVEIAFGSGRSGEVRYREVQNGRVVFRGEVSGVNVTPPSKAGDVWRAGEFSFLASDEASVRRIDNGIIIPGGSTPVQVDSGEYRDSNIDVGCGGDVVIVDPYDNDDIYYEPPDSPAPLPPPAPPPSRPSPPSSEYGPPASDSGGGCDGDDYYPPDDGNQDDPGEWEDSGGCDDSTGDSQANDSGCDGDSGSDYDSGGGGCDGDSSGSDSSGGCDSCEGDVASAAMLPFGPRMLASLWRLSWPIGLVGWFNRRQRRDRK